GSSRHTGLLLTAWFIKRWGKGARGMLPVPLFNLQRRSGGKSRTTRSRGLVLTAAALILVLSSCTPPPDDHSPASTVNSPYPIVRTIALMQVKGTQGVDSIALAPASNVLAAGYDDGKVRLWDLEGSRLLSTLPQDPSTKLRTAPLAATHDGALLAVREAGDGISLWDLQSRAEKYRLHGNSGMVTALAFSTKGSLCASASRDFGIEALDTQDQKEVAALPSPGGNPRQLSTTALRWAILVSLMSSPAARGTGRRPDVLGGEPPPPSLPRFARRAVTPLVVNDDL